MWCYPFSPQAPPFGVPPLAQNLQSALIPPAVHDQADVVAADIGAEPFHVGNAEALIGFRLLFIILRFFS